MLTFLKYFLIEEKGKSHHVTFARCNPPSRMHQKLVDHVVNAAKKDNASHTVFLTRTTGKKDPLTLEQKIKHAKIAFPKANVKLTDSDAPTMLHQAAKLHSQGVNHLHLHVGSDRKDDFERLLKNYNGKPAKEGGYGHYNFHSIYVHSFGRERGDNDSEDESVSGTKMRKAVTDNDRNSFHKMAPTTMNEKQKDALMSDVSEGLKRK